MNLFDQPLTLEDLAERLAAVEAELKIAKTRQRTDCPSEISYAWGLWNMHRAGKGWTAHARQLNLRKLCDLSTVNGKLDGDLAQRIVDQAMEKGWTALYPLKDAQMPLNPAAQHKTPKQALAPAESPLERKLGWIRHQANLGQIDAAERDRQISEATQRHREEVR